MAQDFDKRVERARLNVDERRHRAMRRAHKAGVVRFKLDLFRLNQPRSLVYSPWENVIPLVILVLISLGILLMDMMMGTIALLMSVLVYIFAIRPFVAARVHDRTIKMMMLNLHNFQILWDQGGIMIELTEQPEIAILAPRGSWRDFVKNHLADLMADVGTGRT